MIHFFQSLIKKIFGFGFSQKFSQDSNLSHGNGHNHDSGNLKSPVKKYNNNDVAASGGFGSSFAVEKDISHEFPAELTTEESKIRIRGNKKKYFAGKKWSVNAFHVPEAEGKVRFHDLGLPLSVMHAIFDSGFKYCMPVQAQVLPHTLQGRDATAMAQTGTGKSAAFLITVITRLLRTPIRGGRVKGAPRAIVLAPTRELVIQIEKDAKALAKYTNLRIISVFGGMGYKKQQGMLRTAHVDIVVATPGRLMDFTGQKLIKPGKVEILVVDEADRMLDMGFIPDVRKIIYSTPHKESRQTLFFSATLSSDILRLASQWTKNAVKVEIDPDHTAAESVHQRVYLVTEKEKFIVLYNLIKSKSLDRVLVFVNRRDSTRELAANLVQYGFKTVILSGSVSQKDRLRALDDFRTGKAGIMVATDVAARGLHISGISHVINYDLPEEPEHYIHRIGRTGRAGEEGISVSFADELSSFHIPDIEKVLGNKLECEYPEESMLISLPEPLKKYTAKPVKHRRNSKTGINTKKRRSRYSSASRRGYRKKKKNFHS